MVSICVLLDSNVGKLRAGHAEAVAAVAIELLRLLQQLTNRGTRVALLLRIGKYLTAVWQRVATGKVHYF